MPKRGILERLNNNELVIGDGGFVFCMERRGYMKAGPWTPEVSVEHPEALRQLHREFLRAGADIMQAFTFYASDDKLENRGQKLKWTGAQINAAACKIAREVAQEGDTLFLGGLCQTPTYLSGIGKAATQAIFKKQVDVFVAEKVDFILCEYFEHVEEMEWAIEVAKASGLPVAASMCIGPEGDLHGVQTGECAVRMAKAGASIVGINCHFGPIEALAGMRLMKQSLAKAGIKVHLMIQPLAYKTPDVQKEGFTDLPDFPFALEPRLITRFDVHKYAREAYDLGIRFIGGCCGFEPYHIRAISEELEKEHGRKAGASEKHEPWGAALRMHTKPWVRSRARREHWETLEPATGRPFSPAYHMSEAWEAKPGDDFLSQHKTATTEEEQKAVIKKTETEYAKH